MKQQNHHQYKNSSPYKSHNYQASSGDDIDLDIEEQQQKRPSKTIILTERHTKKTKVIIFQPHQSYLDSHKHQNKSPNSTVKVNEKRNKLPPVSLFHNTLIYLFQSNPKCFVVDSKAYRKPVIIDPLTNERIQLSQLTHKNQYIVDFVSETQGSSNNNHKMGQNSRKVSDIDNNDYRNQQQVSQNSYLNQSIDEMYSDYFLIKTYHQANHQGYLPTSNQKIDVKGPQIEQEFLEQNKDIRTQVKSAIPRYMQIIIHEDYLRSCMKQSQVLIENQFNDFKNTQEEIQDLEEYSLSQQEICFESLREGLDSGYVPDSILYEFQDFLRGEQEIQSTIQTQNSQFTQRQNELKDLKNNTQNNQQVIKTSPRQGLSQSNQKEPKQFKIIADRTQHQYDQFFKNKIDNSQKIYNRNQSQSFQNDDMSDNRSSDNQLDIETSQNITSSQQQISKLLNEDSLDPNQIRDFMGQDSVVSSQQNLQLFTIGNKIQNYQDDIDSEFANNSIKKIITDFTQQQNRPTTNFNPLTSFVALNKQHIAKIQKQQNQYDDFGPFDQVVTPIKRRDQISQEKTKKGLNVLQTSENIRDSVEVQKAQTDKNQKLKHLFHENQLSPRALFHHKNELSQQQKFHQLGDDKASQIQRYLDNLINQGETLFLVHNSFEKRQVYIKLLNIEGDLKFRYLPGNNVILENLTNCTSFHFKNNMNYGDFGEESFQNQFCQRDGRKHFIFSIQFKGVEAPMYLEQNHIIYCEIY